MNKIPNAMSLPQWNAIMIFFHKALQFFLTHYISEFEVQNEMINILLNKRFSKI